MSIFFVVFDCGGHRIATGEVVELGGGGLEGSMEGFFGRSKSLFTELSLAFRDSFLFLDGIGSSFGSINESERAKAMPTNDTSNMQS